MFRLLLSLSLSPSPTPSGPLPPPHDESTNLLIMIIASVTAFLIICAVAIVAWPLCAWPPFSWRQLLNAACSRANKRLKKWIIQRLPKNTNDNNNVSTQHAPECNICIGDFEDGDQIMLLPHCQHEFHLHCIRHWFVSIQLSFLPPLIFMTTTITFSELRGLGCTLTSKVCI